MKNPEVAFIQPIGSLRNLHPSVFSEWKTSDLTLAEWSHRFLLVEMSESSSFSNEDLERAKAFEEKAAQCKTPKKSSQPTINIKTFRPSFNKEKIQKETKFSPGGFGESALSYFDQVNDHFSHIKVILKELRDLTTANNDQLFANLGMLEFEKNKLKAEIGSRNEVVIQEKFDASSVWQSVSLITSWLDKNQLTPMQTRDLASFRAFESWARSEIFKIQRDMKIIMQDITTTRVFRQK